MHIRHDERRDPIDFGSQGQRSRSTLALCMLNLVDTIETTVFAQSLSNFTCIFAMMRGGTLLILGHGFKGQGHLWYFVYKTLWARYRLQFLPNYFQTSHAHCWWWEEELYWFWVTGSKVKVNFCTLCIKPCGHDTDYSFTPITFKLHMSVVDGEKRNPIYFGPQGQMPWSTLAPPPCEGMPRLALSSYIL